MRLSRTILICLLACASVAAQGTQYRFDHLTADNGLPQNSVYSIAQSADGYIWMTTLDGLVRYDGVRFTVFNKSNSRNFPSNRLMGVTFDGEGSLWIFNEAGTLLRYHNGEFRTFTTADGLPGDFVYKILKDPDGKILAFSDKVARFDGERFVVLPEYEDPYSLSMYVSGNGTLWAIEGRILQRIKDGKQTDFALPVDPRDHVYHTLRYDDQIRMFEDRSGKLWICFGSGGQSY